MSLFWSSWVTVLTLVCWLGIVGLLVFTLKYKPNLEEDGTTGHTYDGIQEYDRPLPKWWLVIFWGTLFWGIGYFILFPGLQPDSWAGITTVEVDGQEVPWTQHNELNSQLEANNKVFIDNFEQGILANAGATGATATLAKLNDLQTQMRQSAEPPAGLQAQIDTEVANLKPYVEKLANDPEALKIGGRLFLQNCALCHGSNAKGALGYPNLTDNDWLYGGEADNILITLHNGRIGGMAAWRDSIGESGVRATAEYVLSISGNQNGYDLNKTQVAQGEAIFNQQCVICHGQDAKGMYSAGAPNLTNNIWLYGGSREQIQETIRNGRAGVMPEWESKLGNERIMLLAAYVYSLSDRGATTTAQ